MPAAVLFKRIWVRNPGSCPRSVPCALMPTLDWSSGRTWASGAATGAASSGKPEMCRTGLGDSSCGAAVPTSTMPRRTLGNACAWEEDSDTHFAPCTLPVETALVAATSECAGWVSGSTWRGACTSGNGTPTSTWRGNDCSSGGSWKSLPTDLLRHNVFLVAERWAPRWHRRLAFHRSPA